MNVDDSLGVSGARAKYTRLVQSDSTMRREGISRVWIVVLKGTWGVLAMVLKTKLLVCGSKTRPGFNSDTPSSDSSAATMMRPQQGRKCRKPVDICN